MKRILSVFAVALALAACQGPVPGTQTTGLTVAVEMSGLPAGNANARALVGASTVNLRVLDTADAEISTAVLTDDDLDGIWRGTVQLNAGTYTFATRALDGDDALIYAGNAPDVTISESYLQVNITAATIPTVTVDGTKEAAWTSGNANILTDASSNAVNMLPGDNLGIVYVFNDATNLYIGVNGPEDPWNDDGTNSKSAHINVYLSTNPAQDGTISVDDWTGTITFGGSNRPTHIGHLWTKIPISAGTSGVGGIVAEAKNDGTGASAFAEMRIPLSGLGSVGYGQTIGIILGFKPAENKIGLTDIVPYKTGAVNDYGDDPSAVDPTATDYMQFVLR